jgi:hypothetical protein
MAKKRASPDGRLIAYCYRTGLIEFGYAVPKGCLTIAKSIREDVLRSVVSGNARHAYPPSTDLLVPGIPEAPDDHAAVKAICDFSERIKGRMEL